MSLTLNNTDTPLPDDEALNRGLVSILCPSESDNCESGLRVLSREYNLHSSTYPSEIVRCQMKDGAVLHLHCKYSDEQCLQKYRQGINYEARVYQNVLQESDCKTPVYYGIYNDAKSRITWLILEYMDNVLRASKKPHGLLRAANWLGRFHKESATRARNYQFLKRYDKSYLLKWARQTNSNNLLPNNKLSWIGKICNEYKNRIDILLSVEKSIIHGEFYPANVLMRADAIYPIDWESAAIAAGEVDLAALTEGWPDSITERCVSEYENCRWPCGSPESFREALNLARIYWHLRWLGHNPNWGKERGRLKSLKEEAERSGLI